VSNFAQDDNFIEDQKEKRTLIKRGSALRLVGWQSGAMLVLLLTAASWAGAAATGAAAGTAG
jgi:hypothetical protein